MKTGKFQELKRKYMVHMVLTDKEESGNILNSNSLSESILGLSDKTP